ncbi:FecR domain-containing protein [Dyadobacter chenwenxiniae]|uniref:FecR domain-containing protein n=1 Tax=Dyadobacter chenwenxiniae TaxID=2906456 RepID=A0A9X1PQQ8_9BACT|nr:FecR family protein [Dyadobacter chenwenxiniae]MCF0065191.1 FecR domain-containing protein [Dyadobacter chenwenxiniae]UON84540.1 FecR domain-containing protein [Dyadobacter chenwenxiniae]
MDIDDLYKSLGLEPPTDGENKHAPNGNEIKARIDQTLNFGKARNIFFRKWYAVAAAASILILSATGVYLYNLNSSVPEDMITITAASGETREVTLPDGSHVWLNAASVLRYPAKFGETREVFLEEGEVFFQVKRDTTAPFTVHSAHLDTRVLGTSFRVKAYRELAHEIVTVVTGKVAVSRGAEPLALLEKDQEVIFEKNSGYEKEVLVEAAETVDWKSGNVILKSVRFEDLILAVENAYQVSIHFDRQKFKECENSIRFSTHQSLESVMDLVSDIQGIRYEIDGKEVIVSGEGCQ